MPQLRQYSTNASVWQQGWLWLLLGIALRGNDLDILPTTQCVICSINAAYPAI